MMVVMLLVTVNVMSPLAAVPVSVPLVKQAELFSPKFATPPIVSPGGEYNAEHKGCC